MKKAHSRILTFVSFVLISLLLGAAGYVFAQYQSVTDSLASSWTLAEDKNFESALTQLKTARSNFVVKKIGIKKGEIKKKINDYQKELKNKKKYEEGSNEFSNNNWQKAISLFSKVPDISSYAAQAKLKIRLAQENITQLKREDKQDKKNRSIEKLKVEKLKERLEQELRQNQLEEAPKDKQTNPKADDYVVEYIDDGVPVTWAALEPLTNMIENEHLPSYRKTLEGLKGDRKHLKELISRVMKVRAYYPKSKEIKTLLNQARTEKESNKKLINSLNEIISVTEGVLESIQNREEELYHYYMARSKEVKNKAEDLFTDYRQKHKTTQEQAEKIFSN